MTATPVQVRQWSEDVARDPASLSFLPLAAAYRDGGRREAALKLCIRGLERHPTNVEAHYLLGLLYREGGDEVKAFDEWDIALRLDSEHAGARREIGLVSAARREWTLAVRHLERAAAQDPGDAEVAAALALARNDGVPPSAPAPSAPTTADVVPPAEASPRSALPAADVAMPDWATDPAAATEAPAPPPATVAMPAAAAGTAEDAASDGLGDFDAVQREFRALAAERGVVGAVLLDAQGYVLAGEIVVEGRDRAAEVAANLSGASGEAERAVRHLGLGAWKGILMETPEAIVRLAPVEDGSMVAVAARREVPTGWVLRVAGRARESASRFLRGMAT